MKLIAPKFWQTRNWLSYLLMPLGLLYGWIVAKRRREPLYHSKAKIITVGNVTIGGAGKTPVVMSLAKLLKGKVAILTRGYLGTYQGPVMVNSNDDVLAVGDEALLLVNAAPTCVAKDRLSGIKFLEAKGFEVIITDDGLQDRRFFKDLTILVVDGSVGFGNQFIFPAGPLRENLTTGLKDVDFITVIGEGDHALPHNIAITKARLQSKQQLALQRFIAFAGIGNPPKFFQSVAESGGVVIKNIAFADHHQYTDEELAKLIKLAKKIQATLITTAKDHVRISDKYKHKIQVLHVSLIWQDELFISKYLRKII